MGLLMSWHDDDAGTIEQFSLALYTGYMYAQKVHSSQSIAQNIIIAVSTMSCGVLQLIGATVMSSRAAVCRRAGRSKRVVWVNSWGLILASTEAPFALALS
jgi:hypothetical protein